MVEGMCERLVALRTERRLSQKEVAAVLGLSPSVISQYEAGAAVPRLETIVKLAAFYRCSIDYLLTGKKNVGGQKVLDVSMLNEKQCTLIQEIIDNFAGNGE